MRRARLVSAASILCLLAGALVVGTPSAGIALTKLDGNDTKGILDLRSVTLTTTSTDMIFTLTTFERWPGNAKFGKSNYFLVAFDGDGNGKAERCAFMYYYGGFRGVLTNCGKQTIDTFSAVKAGKKAILTVPNLGSGHWFAASYFKRRLDCRNGCVDTVPNRKWLFNDIDPPTTAWVTSTSGIYESTTLSTTNQIPLEFTATDNSGSIAGWTIRELLGPPESYVDVATGPGSDLSPTLNLDEGRYYVLRPFAEDAAGNEDGGHSFLRLAVPFDDANVVVEYSAGWTHGTGDGFYQGTYSSSSTPGATMTITITTQHTSALIAPLLGPGDGEARWHEATDPMGGWVQTETSSTPKLQRGNGLLFSSPTTTTLQLTVISGTFVIDGVIVGAN